MDVKQRFTLDAPAGEVWQAFQDPALLVSCLPGATLREPIEDNRLKLMFQVKLGPISAAFQGDGELTLDNDAWTGSLQGQGTDQKSNSRVKGEAAFEVISEETKTAVDLTVEFSITGKLAQFSREGIVRALADQLTRDFAENLQQALESQGTATRETEITPTADNKLSTATATRGGATSVPAKPANSSSINGLSLLWRMIVSWWRRLLNKASA